MVWNAARLEVAIQPNGVTSLSCRRFFSFREYWKGESMFYYSFNIGDYQSHTSHLSEMEDLAYRRMLDWCYLHEKPLPEEVDEILR